MRSISIIILLLSVSSPALAFEPDANVQFVMKLRDRGVEAMRAKSLAEFCALTQGKTDLPAMAEFAYGRYAEQIPSNEIENYLKVFRNYFVHVLQTAFRRLDFSQSLEFRPKSIRAGHDRMVSATLGGSETKPGIDLKFIVRETKEAGLRLYNAKFMNIDLLLHLRGEIQTIAEDPANGETDTPVKRIYRRLSNYSQCAD